ncbi:MAG: adenylosuccinate synthetase [Candidatus Pacearchaeota archaeon]
MHTAVIGGLWGDEGKGKIIDFLAKDADIIVRCQGGDNAGHTVKVSSKKFVLHLIPSSILHESKKNIIGSGVVINLDTILQEIDELQKQGIRIDSSTLFISELAHIITPYHILNDILNELSQGIGTTLRGIGPAYADKIRRKGLIMLDLIQFSEEDLKKKVYDEIDEVIAYAKQKGITPEKIFAWIEEKETRKKMLKNFLEKYFSRETFIDKEKVLLSLLEARKKLKNYVADIAWMLDQANKENKKILFEGAQGTMLDICFGSYPFVTCSNTTIGGLYTGTGIGFSIEKKVLVFKAFSTRVGGGPFPTEIKDKTSDIIAEDGTEFGATTGRARRIGWFDAVLARYSARVNDASILAITKLDRLDMLDEIKICYAYEMEGKQIKNVTPTARILEKCIPVFETLPGWKQSTQGIASFEKLPVNAQGYIKRIQELVGIPVKIIGTGQERENIIVVS